MIRDRVGEAEWETFRRCRFVPKIFRPYPCLASPPDDEGQAAYAPYRGQPFDPDAQQLVEGGWDHEHCDVCNARIVEGDRYWTNEGPEHVDLCATCYPLAEQELRD
jgi:hypothetical protein